MGKPCTRPVQPPRPSVPSSRRKPGSNRRRPIRTGAVVPTVGWAPAFAGVTPWKNRSAPIVMVRREEGARAVVQGRRRRTTQDRQRRTTQGRRRRTMQGHRPRTTQDPLPPEPPRSSWSAKADHPRFFPGDVRRNAWLVRLNRTMTMEEGAASVVCDRTPENARPPNLARHAIPPATQPRPSRDPARHPTSPVTRSRPTPNPAHPNPARPPTPPDPPLIPHPRPYPPLRESPPARMVRHLFTLQGPRRGPDNMGPAWRTRRRP